LGLLDFFLSGLALQTLKPGTMQSSLERYLLLKQGYRMYRSRIMVHGL